MKITELPHDCDTFFLNGDFVTIENYVLINDRKEIFRNGKLLKINGDCSFDYPKVKIISSNQFILVDSEKPISSTDQRPNAWIVNNQGEIEQSFYLGCVHRMITTENYIICSYSDSVLGTEWKYGQNGLVVFDYNGSSQFEYYRDEEKNKRINFMENYAFLKKDEDTIYYMPYMDFPIVEFSLVDFSSKVLFRLPNLEKLKNDSFWNPKAFSKKGNDWFFITPDIENSNSRIFKMNTQNKIEEIGKCCLSFFPKGLQDGSFFIPFSGGLGNQRRCQFIEI